MELPLITLKPLEHRGEECIGIYFKHNNIIKNLVRSNAKARWSQTNKCWYVPLSRESYNNICLLAKGKAVFESGELKKYLEKRKQVKTVVAASTSSASSKPLPATPAWRLSKENLDALERFLELLKLKAYSPSTIRTYRNEFLQLLQLLKNKPVNELTPSDLRRYFVYCFEKMKLTENTLHSRINAIKFYYEQVAGKEKFFWEIPRPKKQQQIPKVLSKEEIAVLLKAIENRKHKTMLLLGYGCGLRVSEITGLKVTDIDEDRRILTIRKGKGKKDRVLSLSPAILVMLREYKNKYKPVNYLFEGQFADSAYSIRSLESIIHSAKQKVGIKKSGSMHMLRHSFATHLLDKGTDVVFIQKLLGHNDIKTTLRYLHVTNKDILNILSPVEDIKDLIG